MGWRRIFGLIAGVVVGSLVIMALEMAGHALFHVDEDITSLGALPTGMLLAVVAFYAVASFAGGWAAATIGRNSLPAFGTGGVLLGLGIWNMAMIAHPAWMVAANCVALLVPAIVAGWLVTRRRLSAVAA